MQNIDFKCMYSERQGPKRKQISPWIRPKYLGPNSYIYLNLGPAAGLEQTINTALQLHIIEMRAVVLVGLARADELV